MPITPATKVCTKQTTADSKDTELHALFNNQPRFGAGQIVSALSEWRAITSDPTILEFVTGVKIEFTPGFRPEQDNVRSSMFKRMQHAIVANEIETLINKGVVKHSRHEPGEFISPIFLQPKPDGTYRMIRAFNEFVQYHHFKMDCTTQSQHGYTNRCFQKRLGPHQKFQRVPPPQEKYLSLFTSFFAEGDPVVFLPGEF